MSKYTTEVRFLCESAAGYTESQGFNTIDEILNTAAPLVFNFDFPIFDEEYRLPLEKKILRHYYTREISEETVGLWKLRLQDRLCMIMPYYNQLYESELLEFNPLYDVNVTRTHEGETEGNENTSSTGTLDGTVTDSGTETQVKDTDISDHTVRDEDISNDVVTSHDYSLGESKTLTINETTDDDLTHGKSEQTTLGSTVTDTNNGVRWDLHSDTPQGAVTGIDNEDYLTDVHKIIDSNQINTKVGSGSDTVATTGTDQRDIHLVGSHTETNTQTMDEDTGELTTRTEDENTTRTYTDDTTNTTRFGKIVTTGNETTGTGTKHSTNTDEYIETVIGKQGSVSYSKMIMEFRETFLNIDKMIIEDLKYLFFGLWE